MSEWIVYDEEIDQERLGKWYQTVKYRTLQGKITILHLGPIEWPKQPTDEGTSPCESK